MREARTVDAALRAARAVTPDKTMVVDADTRLSYAALDHSTRLLAANLIDAGVSKGSRVGLLLPNGVTWVQFAVALTRIGAVLVPLSTLLREGELVAQLRTAAVQYVIAGREFRGRDHLAELESLDRDDVPRLAAVWSADDLLVRQTAAVTPELVDALTTRVRPSDPLVIIFTSGSAGPPKGVIHSHGNAFDAVRSGLQARCVNAETRLYLPMPFFWIGGFGGGMLTALSAGATLVTEPTSAPETTLPLLERERVTLFRGWPDQAAALARHADEVGADLSSLRPGSLEALLPEKLRSAPGVRANLFGMTESFGPYCGYPADTDMPETARGSCGRPFDGMDVRVVDRDTGEPVAAGTTGLIQIRGSHVLRGICGRDHHTVFTVDGYYPTGDLGYLDEQGFLFYRGRADDMFKVSGATVYPSEVESALRTLPGVRAAHVTELPGPDRVQVGAAVVCDTSTCSVGELRTAAREVLSAFKVPTVWWLLGDADALPRGASGKVDKNRLRDHLSRVGDTT